MLITNSLTSALANLVIIAGLPFLGYYLFHQLRHKRGFREIASRAGLLRGELKYLGYAALASLLTMLALLLAPINFEIMTREGNAMAGFAGLGLNAMTITGALLYGVVQTGFCEELLFRGLIAGSLGRRMSLPWANLLQGLIFLLPHLLLLVIAPEMKMLLVLIFAGSLFAGWLRIASGSIFGSWMIHASANVTMCLLIAAYGG